MRQWAVTALTVAVVVALAGCGRDDDPSMVWGRHGEPGDTDVVESYRGSDHCNFESVTFLRLSWSVGDGDVRDARMYVRDPDSVLSAQTVADYDAAAQLPVDARFSGYSSSLGELWLAPLNQDTVAYVVADDGAQVEAWPRTRTLIGCD